jgi:hypothetical protein
MDTSSGGSRTPGKTVPFTKVNRCMAEGRKRFLEVFAALYGG